MIAMSSRHEIYFAVGKYADPNIPAITCCEHDATNLASAFSEIYFKEYGPPIQTIISTHEEPMTASKIGILRAFEKAVSRVREDDTLVVTFSGHGAFHQDESYWVPHDAAIGTFDSMIPFSWIKTILDRIKCKFRVILIDACHSGDAKPQFKGAQNNLSFSESSTSVRSLVNSSAGLAYGTACTFSEFAYVAPGGNSSVWIDSLVEFVRGLDVGAPLFVDELLLRSAIATSERVRGHFNRTQTPYRVIKAAGVIPLGFKQP